MPNPPHGKPLPEMLRQQLNKLSTWGTATATSGDEYKLQSLPDGPHGDIHISLHDSGDYYVIEWQRTGQTFYVRRFYTPTGPGASAGLMYPGQDQALEDLLEREED